MTRQSLPEKLETRLAAVCETTAARSKLESNSLDQQFVFVVDDSESITIHLKAHESTLAVTTGASGSQSSDRDESPAPIAGQSERTITPQYETTWIYLTRAQLHDLLDGAFLSALYLDDGVEIRGLQPAWLLLGYLFGINHDLLRDV